MTDPADILRKCARSPSLTSEYKLQIRSQFRGPEKELIHSAFTVRQSVTYEQQVAGNVGVWGDGVMSFRINAVVNRIAVTSS